MAHTYTTNNSKILNGGTITLNTGAGCGGAGTGLGHTIGGGAGQVYTVGTGVGTGTTVPYYNGTTTGTSYQWANPTDNVMVVKNSPPELEVKGRMVLNGVDLEERLKTIEKVLQIPERDVKLEKKHPKLKKLYDEYIAALGKYRTFETIKGEEDGTT